MRIAGHFLWIGGLGLSILLLLAGCNQPQGCADRDSDMEDRLESVEDELEKRFDNEASGW